jgi:AcrR family transcriptional regulator
MAVFGTLATMTNPTVDDEPVGDRVQRIADELLAADGPTALSLRRIAERADTSTQAVYTRFGGKPGLADALYRSGYARLADELASVAPVDDPIERIRDLAAAYRRVALANPGHYELMTGRPIPEYTPPTDSRRFAASTLQPLIDAISEACSAGLLTGEPRTLAERFWAAGHGRISLELHGLIEVDDDEAADYVDHVIDAHRPR